MKRITTLDKGLLSCLAFFFLFSISINAQPVPPVDVPITLFATHSGNIKAVDGGVTLYPNLTSGTFNVTLDACASGTPTITAAYLTYYSRVRSVEPDEATMPTFDNEVEVQINGGGFTTVNASDDAAGPDGDGDDVFNANLDATGGGFPRTFWRAYRVIDLVQEAPAVANALTAGVNTIDVQGIDLATGVAEITNNNYGVALTVFYDCDDFDSVDAYYNAGLDFVYCNQGVNGASTDYVGDFSGVVCQTIPVATSSRSIAIEGIIGGQQNAVAPFRGHGLYAWSGTGAVPTTVASAPISHIPVGAYDFNGLHNTLVSNLGQEWDEINGALTVPAGDTYVCVQMESMHGPNHPGVLEETCISGDLLSPYFVVPAVCPPARCGTSTAVKN